MRHDQHLLLPCSCCVRVRGVGFSLDFLYRPAFERCVHFFLFFRIAPGGQKPRNLDFLNAPGRICRLFHPQNRTAPGGVYSHYYGMLMLLQIYSGVSRSYHIKIWLAACSPFWNVALFRFTLHIIEYRVAFMYVLVYDVAFLTCARMLVCLFVFLSDVRQHALLADCRPNDGLPSFAPAALSNITLLKQSQYECLESTRKTVRLPASQESRTLAFYITYTAEYSYCCGGIYLVHPLCLTYVLLSASLSFCLMSESMRCLPTVDPATPPPSFTPAALPHHTAVEIPSENDCNTSAYKKTVGLPASQ